MKMVLGRCASWMFGLLFLPALAKSSDLPVAKELLAQARLALCAQFQDQPCPVLHMTHLARLAGHAGAPAVDVLRWDLCEADSELERRLEAQRAEGACSRSFWRLSSTAQGLSNLDLLTVERNGGTLGYGVGGGDESVSLDPVRGELLHAIEGGSSWRWQVERRWALQPSVRLIEDARGVFSRHQVEWGQNWRWRAEDGVLNVARSTVTCQREEASSGLWKLPPPDGAQILEARGADLPTLAPDAAFDWRQDALPEWLELRADAQPGPRRHTVVLTSGALPKTSLALRLLRLPTGQVLIEWQGLDHAAISAYAPRLEVWRWTHPVASPSVCLIPGSSPKASAGAVEHEEDFEDEVRPVRGAHQVLIDVQGQIQPAWQSPDEAAGSGRPFILERSEKSARQRWLLSGLQTAENAPDEAPGFALALSLKIGKRQHLVSHLALRFRDPSSFLLPVIRRDGGYWFDPAEQWREALAAHRKALQAVVAEPG